MKFEEKAIEAIERAIEKGNGFVVLDGIMMNWLLEKLKNEPSCEEVKEGYDKGLNDAWEYLKRIKALKDADICEHILEGDAMIPLYEVLNNFTPQEAIVRLKAYEKAQNQIEVGDVVLLDTCPFIEYVVLTKDDNEVNVYSLIPEGTYPLQRISKDHFDMIKKTGKHINLAQILKRIGGE